VKFTGDGILALFDGPGRALDGVLELRERLLRCDLPIRAGLHTGEVELRGADVAGLAVHLASRVMGVARAGEIVVTGTVRDLVVGTLHHFDAAGVHTLKGVPEQRALYRLAEPATSTLQADGAG